MSSCNIEVDAKSGKIMPFGVTKGDAHDSEKLCAMMRDVAEEYSIDNVYWDKAYDNRSSFNLLDI